MNAREMNVFLTRAALLDPRMKRTSAAEQADMAMVWAEILADVSLEAALEALAAHYRVSSVPIMPANVLTLAGVEEVSTIPDVTQEVIEESKARALAAAGVTEAEVEAHAGDVDWLRAHFPARTRELEPIHEGGWPA